MREKGRARARERARETEREIARGGVGLCARADESWLGRLWHEFQSHEAEFDYLKSLEIEEKINCLRWCVCVWVHSVCSNLRGMVRLQDEPYV